MRPAATFSKVKKRSKLDEVELSCLGAENPSHVQIPSPMTDAKIGKVFHEDVA